jgi:hypothetical protein
MNFGVATGSTCFGALQSVGGGTQNIYGDVFFVSFTSQTLGYTLLLIFILRMHTMACLMQVALSLALLQQHPVARLYQLQARLRLQLQLQLQRRQLNLPLPLRLSPLGK